MTITELRQSEEYRTCMDKIRKYKTGFEFTIPFYRMSKGQANAMHRILRDAYDEGLIESVSFVLNLEGECTEETWRRL